MTQVSTSVIILSLVHFHVAAAGFRLEMYACVRGVRARATPEQYSWFEVCSQVCFFDRPEGAAMLRVAAAAAAAASHFTRLRARNNCGRRAQFGLLGHLYDFQKTRNNRQNMLRSCEISKN